MQQGDQSAGYPRIDPLGLGGWLVRFADRLDEGANRAALAFRAQLEAEGWEDVAETATGLASVLVRFDPLGDAADPLRRRLSDLLAARDWSTQALPEGRRRWTVPCAFGGDAGPQLAEAAELAGLSEAEAIEVLTDTTVRVLTLGFAPGQPYLGTLPEAWDLPRQQGLTPSVPGGALVVAVRQLVLFTAATPTGWRHVGQTAFACFRPDSDPAFPLRPGDEMRFRATSPEEIAKLREAGGDGGATCEDLP